MSDMMSITDMLARLRADAASEQFEGARLGPIAVRELLRYVGSLVAEAAELRRERDELSEQAAFTARHLAIISGVLGSPEPIEVDDIAARLHLLIAERNALAARLAEIEAQEPVAWVPIHPRTGPLWSMTTGSPDEERLPHYPLEPLYTRPAPATELRCERDDQAAGQAQAMADMQKNIQYLDGLRQGWSTHAADLAQRAADLEALVAELRRERDELHTQVHIITSERDELVRALQHIESGAMNITVERKAIAHAACSAIARAVNGGAA